jgi:hypothetical protein
LRILKNRMNLSDLFVSESFASVRMLTRLRKKSSAW